MKQFRSPLVALSVVAVAAVGAMLIEWLPHSPSVLESTAIAANNAPQSGSAKEGHVKVDVVKPHRGGMDRTSVQPGSIHAYESAELFAKVSGYLQKLNVDIGDRVTSGQLLAELDAPELHRDVECRRAAVQKAIAQVGQAKARIVATQADFHAAETGIARAEAGVKRDEATLAFRDKQHRRFQELVDAKSVDERIVDEKEDLRLAAQAAVDASEANVAESKALTASASAKIEQARADLVDAEAEVDLAKANLAKAEVLAGYTHISAPYDGVITSRAYHRGDFIRAAEQNGVVALLNVERTDVVRLVVYVPDGDVPFTHPGDLTETTIDSLPGHKFTGKVSRIAFSEDKKTKTMRTEIDLPNEQGLLRNGMYGRTKLLLETGNPDTLTVPSSAMSGSTKNGKGALFVVRDGAAKKLAVAVSADNGVLTEITEGLDPSDMVIVGNNNSIVDGRLVDAHELIPAETAKK